MNKQSVSDILIAQLPSHIKKSYPRLVQFLQAYYDWLNTEGNPYERVKNHLDYLSFKESLTEYVTELRQEYLYGIPEETVLDKELLIKWSKKFTLSKGSHNSYRFLFSILYGETDVDIYLPKDNVLRTSDGEWISGESKILVTNTSGVAKFNLARITQVQEPFPGVFVEVVADVQEANLKYVGGYNTIELVVTNINGEFNDLTPITVQDGSEFLIPSSVSFNIGDGGSGYQPGSRVECPSSIWTKTFSTDGTESELDTELTTNFQPTQITVRVDGVATTDFEYDGRFVTGSFLNSAASIEIDFPTYGGYHIVESVDSNGSVKSIQTLDMSIGLAQDLSVSIDSSIGTGFTGSQVAGLVLPVGGKYISQKGQLSSTMYLQDGFYYQDYSYVITKTEKSLAEYEEIVKRVLHPAGFAMFGLVTVTDVLNLLLSENEMSSETKEYVTESRSKYSLGPNYSFAERFLSRADLRLYKINDFNDDPNAPPVFGFGEYFSSGLVEDVDNYVLPFTYKPGYSYRYDFELSAGQEDKFAATGAIEPGLIEGDNTYDLVDFNRQKMYVDGLKGFFGDSFVWVNDIYTNTPEPRPVKNWMTRHNLCDYYAIVSQDYVESNDSGDTYFEQDYISTREES